MRLDGAHVLVTGATRGIGRCVAEVMAGRGARLSLVARNADALDQTAAELDANPIHADLSDPDATGRVVPAAEEAAGPIDVLINNAALNPVGPLARIPKEALLATVHTNLHAPLELTRAALPSMLERRSGAIANITSMAGAMAMRNAMPYGTTKAGLMLGTRSLKRELRGTGVHVHLVVLGIVNTEMVPRAAEEDELTRATTDRFADRITPLDRWNVAERIVDAVADDRRRDLILPAAAAGMLGLTNVPTRAADLLWMGLPPSY
jgi:short-subunit dehydrogenase